MRNLLRSLKNAFSDDPRAREEAYLAASVDRVDLEYRQRQIDRGLFREDRYRSFGY